MPMFASHRFTDHRSPITILFWEECLRETPQRSTFDAVDDGLDTPSMASCGDVACSEQVRRNRRPRPPRPAPPPRRDRAPTLSDSSEEGAPRRRQPSSSDLHCTVSTMEPMVDSTILGRFGNQASKFNFDLTSMRFYCVSTVDSTIETG